MPPGRLVTAEGIRGAGKTTLTEALCAYLLDRGVDAELVCRPVRVDAADRLHVGASDCESQLTPRARSLMSAADHARFVETWVAPQVARRAFVLVDSFARLTLPLEGAESRLLPRDLASLNRFAQGGLVPDRTLILDLEPDVAEKRTAYDASVNRRADLGETRLFRALISAYRPRETDPRVRVLDAAQPPGNLLVDAVAAIADLIP